VYERALDRCTRVLRDITALRIDERLVQIQSRVSEQQGHAVAEAVRAILADLELTPQQQARVSEVVPRRLRELATDAARSFTQPRRLTLQDLDRELELLRSEGDALRAEPDEYGRPALPRDHTLPGPDGPGAAHTRNTRKTTKGRKMTRTRRQTHRGRRRQAPPPVATLDRAQAVDRLAAHLT